MHLQNHIHNNVTALTNCVRCRINAVMAIQMSSNLCVLSMIIIFHHPKLTKVSEQAYLHTESYVAVRGNKTLKQCITHKWFWVIKKLDSNVTYVINE